ncbi:MAG TPA: hypothetical protein VGN42_25180 [Pirellulales bacterium]|nr:hypothetical protein [Pirellulales bacterium]
MTLAEIRRAFRELSHASRATKTTLLIALGRRLLESGVVGCDETTAT